MSLGIGLKGGMGVWAVAVTGKSIRIRFASHSIGGMPDLIWGGRIALRLLTMLFSHEIRLDQPREVKMASDAADNTDCG